MALISCPECKATLSQLAEACPRCGAPFSNRNNYSPSRRASVTVELTSKKLKLHILFSSACFWFGIVLLGIGGNTNSELLSVLAAFLFLGGMIWYIVTKIRVWWNHD